MELLQLKYFKTVAETGKISAAAEALFISAPALSTSISRLEKELGFPLFDRTHNAIRLNRQGQIFLRYVNQVFATLDCARMEMRQSMLLQGQHVSVATLSANVWIDLIAAFSQEYPHFTLSCTSLRLSQFAASGLGPQYSFLLAEYDSFIVIPLTLKAGDNEAYRPQLGDYAAVVVDNRVFPAIVGDYGPRFKAGEASLRLARLINPKATPFARPVSHLGVSYIIFPGTKEPENGPIDYNRLNTRVQELLNEMGGLTQAAQFQQVDDPLAPKPQPAPAQP